jgi:hypothetical protein
MTTVVVFANVSDDDPAKPIVAAGVQLEKDI